MSVLDCGAHVALSMSMVTSDEVPSVVEASVSVENASSKSACEDSGVQCPEMSHPTLNCHDVRPKLRSMKREQLVTELRKWDPNFLDNEGLTTEMLKATLTRFYAANPIGGGPSEKMPAVSKMSKTDLLNLCRCRGILCEAREHIGELRLKVQKDFRKRMEAPATPQDTVLFGKMKGYSYEEVLDNKSYASWVVNTAAESNNSSPDLMRLATFLREKGVYPTEERSGTADTHNCASGVQCPVDTAADSTSPTMPPTASSVQRPASNVQCPTPEEPEPQKVKELDGKTAHNRVSRAGRKRRDVDMADDSPPTEMAQMMAMVKQLSQEIRNLHTRVTEVENNRRPHVECHVMTDGSESSFVMTDGGLSSSTESRRAS